MADASRATDEAGEVRAALLTLRRISGLPMAFGGPVAGPGRLRISELSGASTNALRGLAVTSGSGLGGKAVALARPFAVTDYPAARTISHEYDGAVAREGLRSVVAVPVVVGGTVRAVLYGALRDALPMGARVMSASVTAARELAQRLAEHDEAERLLSRFGAPDRPRRERGGSRGPDDAPGRPVWEEVRQAHSELRALAREVDDPALRSRLDEVCATLVAASPARNGDRRGAPRPYGLPTVRELDVLALVATGCTNAEAARRLGLRPETVKSYLRSAMRRLGCRTRLEAVVAARRAGLLP